MGAKFEFFPSYQGYAAQAVFCSFQTPSDPRNISQAEYTRHATECLVAELRYIYIGQNSRSRLQFNSNHLIVCNSQYRRD